MTPKSPELNAPGKTKFAIEKHGKLNYLNNTMPGSGAHFAGTWHQILGLCNMNNVFKLEDVVEGMKIRAKTF